MIPKCKPSVDTLTIWSTYALCDAKDIIQHACLALHLTDGVYTLFPTRGFVSPQSWSWWPKMLGGGTEGGGVVQIKQTHMAQLVLRNRPKNYTPKSLLLSPSFPSSPQTPSNQLTANYPLWKLMRRSGPAFKIAVVWFKPQACNYPPTACLSLSCLVQSPAFKIKTFIMLLIFSVCRCCHRHDCCYGDAELLGCRTKTDQYHWTCEDKTAECGTASF